MAIQPFKMKQETSMGRKLFGMAAPIIGGIYGGPAGAAAGAAIGAKVTGAENKDAALAGLSSYAGSTAKGAASPAAGASAGGGSAAPISDAPTSLSRKYDALAQNPMAGVSGGLDVLAGLDQDDPLRKEIAPTLIRAQMMANRRA